MEEGAAVVVVAVLILMVYSVTAGRLDFSLQQRTRVVEVNALELE